MTRIPPLLSLALLAAGGCYAPDLRDCTVTCGAADDCAGDQVCTGGFCAADGVTCTGGGATTDAPVATIMLRVDVEGTGTVVIDGVGECTDDQNSCTWTVPAKIMQFEARQIESDKLFERWTTLNCPQSTQTSCTFTPTSSTTVGAKFQ